MATHALWEDRQSAEAASRLSEARYRAVSELTSDFAYAVAVRPDGTLVHEWATEAFTHITGYTPEEVDVRGGLPALAHPEDQPAVARRWAALRAGEPGVAEFRILTKTGEVRWLRDHTRPEGDAAEGRVVRIYGAAQDVTAYKRMGAALRESEVRYRQMFEGNQAIQLLIDPRSGAIVDANPAAAAFYGYTLDEIKRCTITDVNALSPERVAEEMALASAMQRSYFLFQHRLATGAVRDVEVHSSPIDMPGGQLLYSIIHDITERREAEARLHETAQQLEEALADLLRAQSQLVQQERLRALGEMASGIAHDFNNALAPILGYSELLLHRPEQWGDTVRVTEYLQLINTGAQDAASVVRRLREFARIQDPDETFQRVQVNDLILEAVALTQPKWKDQALSQGRQITVETDLPADPAVSGDAANLREALTNLIFNAVDALPAGGAIVLRTRVEADRVVVEVSDTGCGMAEAVRQRCLEPFFSTKGEHGTGLGLAMVFGIIRRHSGTLDVESAPGRGTTFRIRLPQVTDHRVVVRPPAAAAPARPLRVLLVEDEARLRKVASAYLTADGHTVETASSGADGLEQFRVGRFDLVITDYAMPGMAGDQLARAIKQLSPTTPVVMMTGFGDMMDAAGTHPDGVDRLVSKPATLAELRQAVAQVIGNPGGPLRSPAHLRDLVHDGVDSLLDAGE